MLFREFKANNVCIIQQQNQVIIQQLNHVNKLIKESFSLICKWQPCWKNTVVGNISRCNHMGGDHELKPEIGKL